MEFARIPYCGTGCGHATPALDPPRRSTSCDQTKGDTMTTSPAQILQTLLANPIDFANVKSVTTPDVTYVSLSENNPELKRYLPWTGTNHGPEAIVRAFEGIGRAWETKAFEVREVLVQDDKVAMFGSFTYRGRKSGQEITSPFALLAKLRDGKIHYAQFLEDTFGTSGTLGRPR